MPFLIKFWHPTLELISEMKKQTKRSKSRKAQAKTKTKSVAKEKKARTKNLERKEEEVEIDLPSPYEMVLGATHHQVKLHKNYTVDVEAPIANNLKNWFNLYLEKEKRRNREIYRLAEFSYFPTFEFELGGEKPDHDKCSICQFEYEPLSDADMEKQLVGESENDIIMIPCSHLMHYGCLKMLIGEKEWIKCPVCSTIYGKMMGDQPPGNMTWNLNPMMHCDGYPDCGTYVINYQMHSGKKGNISFPGTNRTAYLPDNPQGQQVLNLLKEAFDRKLIFTVGRSVTTGRDNQIVWNGVHHKTNTHGGSSHFGYPDPTYFDRVKLELAAKGVHPHEI